MSKHKSDLALDEFWMGMAVFLSGGSPVENGAGAVLVDGNNEPICFGFDAYLKKGKLLIPVEKTIASKCGQIFSGTMYITRVPLEHCLVDVLSKNINRILYISSNQDTESQKETLKNSFAVFQEFSDNLYWMRDYVKLLTVQDKINRGNS